jgi:hypothetical protein
MAAMMVPTGQTTRLTHFIGPSTRTRNEIRSGKVLVGRNKQSGKRKAERHCVINCWTGMGHTNHRHCRSCFRYVADNERPTVRVVVSAANLAHVSSIGLLSGLSVCPLSRKRTRVWCVVVTMEDSESRNMSKLIPVN